MDTTIDLVGPWEKFWDVVSGALPDAVNTTIVLIGIGLILFTVIKYLWDKRRGQGGKASPVWWTLAFGAVLLAPDVLLPLVLSIFEIVINLFLRLVQPIWG